MRRSIVPIAVAVTAAFSAGAFLAVVLARRYATTRELTEELEAAPVVAIDVLGALRVVAGDVEHVHVNARVVGTEEATAAYELGIERDGDTLHLRAPGTPKGGGFAGIGMRVVVPRGTRVRVHASAGAVSANGLDDIEIVNRVGPIAVRDVGGSVRVRTGAGPIAVMLTKDRAVTGVDVESKAGPIAVAVPRALGADYEIVARTGPVQAPASVEGGVPVRIQAGAGPVAIAVR
jgi:hypothetical protein